MKNIHVLPTDNYSPIVYSTSKYGGLFLSKYYSPTKDMGDFYQNIYITSNEEIKEGVDQWYLDKVLNEPYNSGGAQYSSKQNVIILTTDQSLDGVQKIDDEFLKWFVKNPSCKEVEVTYGVLKPFQSEDKGYLIHCPDNEVLEEPKQELRKVCKCKRAYENPLSEICSLCWNELYPNEKDKIKDEDLLEPIQETLEKAAVKYSEGWGENDDTKSFIQGAKWQQERMYNEEDLLGAFEAGMMFIGEDKGSFKEWFEQFKKK